MRVALLADPIDNQNAGIHVFTKEMVNAMIRNNPGHEIILIREKVDNTLKGIKQIALLNIRLPIGYASLRLFFMVPFVLHRNRVNVVIEPAHFGPFNLLPHIKRVTIIHDLTPILFPSLHRWHSQFLQKVFLKSILNKTDLILANSDNTATDICKVYPQNCNKVKRIYPGKGKYFKPEINTSVLEKFKIEPPYFLVVGTIEPRKNLLMLLEAYRIFLEKNHNGACLIITGGTGWKSEPFFEALKNHPDKNKIICTGFVEDDELPALYSHAIALIYPSVYEGFGLPIVEAMSCGTPVIAADNSSLKEAGGDGAIYFNSSDPKSLAQNMFILQNDPVTRSTLSKKAILHSEKFNWDIFAKEFWKLLETKFPDKSTN